MYWKITAYNGTTWEATRTMYIEEAISLFVKDTGLCQWDIKSIINQH